MTMRRLTWETRLHVVAAVAAAAVDDGGLFGDVVDHLVAGDAARQIFGRSFEDRGRFWPVCQAVARVWRQDC